MQRSNLLNLALSLQHPATFEAARRDAGDDLCAHRSLLLLRMWARFGAQSVEMPHTYAAALMATDSGKALEGQPLPWPAFEIQVPPGLLTSSHGQVFSVFVGEMPPDVVITGRFSSSPLFVGYFDPFGIGVNSYEKLTGMFDGEAFWARAAGKVADDMAALYDPDLEKRLWAMIGRLVGGVVLAIAQARDAEPELFGPRALRTKRDAVRPNRHALGAPLTIDCRQSIADYVLGNRRDSPHVQTLVRGHWRHQPHGPQSSLRRLQWIAPFFRGEGPLTIRTTRLRGDDQGGTP